MTIGERVKELRCNLGMTQEELAKSIGYNSRSAINKIESGERRLNQNTISKLAKSLQTTPSYLMGWEDEETENKKNPPVALSEREILKSMIDSVDDELLILLRNFLKYLLWLENQQEEQG